MKRASNCNSITTNPTHNTFGTGCPYLRNWMPIPPKINTWCLHNFRNALFSRSPTFSNSNTITKFEGLPKWDKDAANQTLTWQLLESLGNLTPIAKSCCTNKGLMKNSLLIPINSIRLFNLANIFLIEVPNSIILIFKCCLKIYLMQGQSF